MIIVAPYCKLCGGRVLRAAKSHTHYQHRNQTGCELFKVQPEQITMRTIARDPQEEK